MVERDGHVAHRSRDDLAVAHDGPLRDPADAEDGDLRIVDDRRLQHSRELAGARDRERRSAQLIWLQRTIARSVGEPLDLGLKLVDGPGATVAHDRDDESLFGLYGNAEV